MMIKLKMEAKMRKQKFEEHKREIGLLDLDNYEESMKKV